MAPMVTTIYTDCANDAHMNAVYIICLILLLCFINIAYFIFYNVFWSKRRDAVIEEDTVVEYEDFDIEKTAGWKPPTGDALNKH